MAISSYSSHNQEAEDRVTVREVESNLRSEIIYLNNKDDDNKIPIRELLAIFSTPAFSIFTSPDLN